MSEQAAYIRSASLCLARTLDEVGLNVHTVKTRRKCYLYLEQIKNAEGIFKGHNQTIYHFGSQTEGSTIPELGSDIDNLYCRHAWNVIEDWADWEKGDVNLLMLHENTAPGYCRLQLLRPDVPMGREDLPTEHCTYDSSGRVIMKNTTMHCGRVQALGLGRSGPANTDPDDGDHVRAFACRTWPGQAEEFIRRPRRHGWPSRDLIQQATKHGVFLVPVGYKLSTTEPLEWRISASLTERYLMLSLTIVHLQCYVVLKMLVKTFVEPRVQKCISSYHCKTALLFCTENTEPGFWRQDNLIPCITMCLERLLAWVRDGFCPQFVMPESNLFAGKVTAANTGIVQTVLENLVNSNARALLKVRIAELGAKLQANINMAPLPARAPVSDVTVVEFAKWERIGLYFMNCFVKDPMIILQRLKPMELIRFVHKCIKLLRAQVDNSHKQAGRVLHAVIRLLCRWLGSLLASFSLSNQQTVPRQALQLLHGGAKLDAATLLKLASVFYCSGNLRQAEMLLYKLSMHFDRTEFFIICQCSSTKVTHQQVLHLISIVRNKGRVPNRQVAHCVRFSAQEIHCVPPALRHELHRSVDDDIHHRRPEQDKWMDLAAVDCLPYLFYMQYITYRQLGKHDLQKRALLKLDQCVREDPGYGHPETAWNLLGQCLELEVEPETAMACYRTSLQIRARNNAANWHVQNLRYTAIRHGCLPEVAGW